MTRWRRKIVLVIIFFFLSSFEHLTAIVDEIVAITAVAFDAQCTTGMNAAGRGTHDDLCCRSPLVCRDLRRV